MLISKNWGKRLSENLRGGGGENEIFLTQEYKPGEKKMCLFTEGRNKELFSGKENCRVFELRRLSYL